MEQNYDQIGGTGLKILQSDQGVKASVDGLLLARFVKPEYGWRVADLGCGNGLVGLLMAHDNPACSVVGVEIQEGLIRQAARSAAANSLTNISFLRTDLKNEPWTAEMGRFDMVTANPPYRKVGTGRLSPDPVRAAARHEILGSVDDFARAASNLLRDGAVSTWVFLAERVEDLKEAVSRNDMEPVRSRFILPRKGEEPSLVLLEAIKGGGVGMFWEEEPLVLYKGEGRDYTYEARGILYGE
jgi:tRNA1Val (adenine37-N6)-methyltransferase